MASDVKRVGLFRATSIVFVAIAISAAFGLLREVLIAWEFGTSKLTDAYFFAYDFVMVVPQFLMGGMAAALIAIYAASRSDRDTNEAFASTIINVYVLGLLFATVVFALVAPVVGPLLASGFEPAERELVIRLLWCLTPTIFLFGLALILKSLLEAEQFFFVSQVSTSFLAIAIIGTILFFADSWGIYCLPLGMLIGLSCQSVWTAYWLRRSGFRFRRKLDLQSPEFRRFLSLLWPGVFGGLIVGVIPLVDKSMASHLNEGTVACLSFAGRPMSMVTRFGLYSLITALLPTFALQAAEDDPVGLRETVSGMLRVLVFLTVPLSMMLAVLRGPIIQLLFQRGNFGAESTALTSNIFAALALGLCPMAIAVALATVFKALQDTKTAAFVGGGSNLIAKVAFNFLLIGPLGAIGLGLSSSLQYVTSAILLLFCLHRKLHGVALRPLAITTGKVGVAAAVAFVVVHWIVAESSWQPIVICVVGSITGSIVYLVASSLLRTQELTEIWMHMADSQMFRRLLPTNLQRLR